MRKHAAYQLRARQDKRPLTHDGRGGEHRGIVQAVNHVDLKIVALVGP